MSLQSSLVGPAPWLDLARSMSRFAWDIGVVVVAALTGALILLGSSSPTPAQMAVGFVVLLVIIAGHFLFARHSLLPDRNGLPLQIFMVGMIAAGGAFTPNLLWFQIFLYPAVWLASATIRHALIANVATFIAIVTPYVAGLSIRNHLETRQLIVHVAFQSIGLGFSLVLGLWMTWLMFDIARRNELLTEVSEAQAEIKALSHEAGAEEERKRISRDIHDAIAQSLVSQVMLAQKLQRELGSPTEANASSIATAELLENTANTALLETRQLIAENANATPALPGRTGALQ